MIIGTHNSLTYAKPTKWYGKILNFTSKCQNLSIEEQFNLGVRLFDIRIVNCNINKYTKHGLIEYDITPKEAIDMLNKLAENTKINIFIYINSESKLETQNQIQEFSTLLKELENDTCEYITICGGYTKPGWKKVVDCTNPVIYEKHWEFLNFTYYCNNKFIGFIRNVLHFSPKYWAKKYNSKIKNKFKKGFDGLYNYMGYNDTCILMLDFFEL